MIQILRLTWNGKIGASKVKAKPYLKPANDCKLPYKLPYKLVVAPSGNVTDTIPHPYHTVFGNKTPDELITEYVVSKILATHESSLAALAGNHIVGEAKDKSQHNRNAFSHNEIVTNEIVDNEISLLTSSDKSFLNFFAMTAEQIAALTESEAGIPIPEKTAKGKLADNENAVANRTAKSYAQSSQKLRVSRRLMMTERARSCTIVCPDTGIVSLLDIPSIPGIVSKTMIWTSPYASTSNCRGIAQQDVDFLKTLDTQVLAGVLITLANVYDLLRFRPADSGAQKNAILRTAGKAVLIRAIKTLEDFIHSRNMHFMPKLSLVLDTPLFASDTGSMLNEWLKRITEIIYEQDKTPEDDTDYNAKYRIKPQYSKDADKAAKKESWAQTQARWALQREFKEDKKAAKIAISLLAETTAAKPKLITILNQLFGSDDVILTMTKEFLLVVQLGLDKYPSEAATTLSKLIFKDRSKLTASDDPFADELEAADDPVFKTIEELTNYQANYQEPTVSEDALDHTDDVEELAEGKDKRNTNLSSEELDTTEAEESDSKENHSTDIKIVVGIDLVEYWFPADQWNALSFIGKLRAKKDIIAAYPENHPNE